MTDKVTLANVGSLIDATTAANTINSNSAAIVAAMDNTLSRDGTTPNQMGANLDMNSNHLLNLPAPVNNTEPLRLQDVALIAGGGIISSNPLPVAGTVGQVLTKKSSTNYDTQWANQTLTLGAGQVLGSNIAANTVTNGNLATVGATTLKGNPTTSSATAADFTIDGLVTSATPSSTLDFLLIKDSVSSTFKKVNIASMIGSTVAGVTSVDSLSGAFTTANGLASTSNTLQLSAARRTLPTRQTLLSGSGTYTTPANCIRISVRMVGGGGGGGANGGAGLGSSGTGGTTSFNSVTAIGGTGANATNTTGGGAGGAGGTGGVGTASYRTPGMGGGTGYFVNANYAPTGGFWGGNSILGMGASAISTSITPTGAGGGGGGASNVGGTFGNGGGGGGGEYVELNINSPAATYAYIVGPGGTAGTGGSGGGNAGSGAAGRIIIDEYYGS